MKAAPLLALLALTCAPSRRLPLPRIAVYDTRYITEHVADSAVENAVVRIGRAAYPKEAGLCFYGDLVSSLDADSTRVWRVHVKRATAAVTMRADSFTITFVHGGCEPSSREAGMLLGIAHTHPHTPDPESAFCRDRPDACLCQHSWADSRVFASWPHLILSYVFCGDRTGEMLFRDTRRVPFRWGAMLAAQDP